MDAPKIPTPESCITIRARIRKSKRAIDPEFDTCQETLVSFVDAQRSKSTSTPSKNKGGPSLLITPVPTQNHVRSLSHGRMVAPSKRRNRSFSRKSSLGEMNDSTSDCDGMVDVSLEDEKAEHAQDSKNSCATSQHSHLLNPKPGLPPQPMSSSLHNHQRYSSPLAVRRTSSGLSNGGSLTSNAISDSHLSSSVRSQSSARSRSRSRSRRRMGGHMRMRSLGAASAFAAANAGAEEEDLEVISIPLWDVLSVDEEVPSRKGAVSDFYSSAASEVGAQKEKKEMRISSPSPPPSSTKKASYRIFLHTLSHGYVEFSLENANSHDMVMAYLKAHLEPDRIPKREDAGNAKQVGGALLRTIVLTPTKDVPSSLGSSTHTSSTVKAGNALNLAANAPRSPPPTSLPHPNLTRSNSTVSCAIDKLHSKVIHQRLQNESTPLQRMKESLEGWMSSVMDCGCCQDTTVAPLGVASSIQGTPYSKKLRARGVAGLSFEESCAGPSPKLSFERSVGGESWRK